MDEDSPVARKHALWQQERDLNNKMTLNAAWEMTYPERRLFYNMQALCGHLADGLGEVSDVISGRHPELKLGRDVIRGHVTRARVSAEMTPVPHEITLHKNDGALLFRARCILPEFEWAYLAG